MLSFFENRCIRGRVSRRQLLTAGAVGGGLSLAGLLRAEPDSGIGSSCKAVINVHLDGGPPQMDMIDLKPNAPSEIRGEFNPIATKIPGIQICELLPKLAAAADKLVFIRSLIGAAGAHDAFQCQSGFDAKNQYRRPAGYGLRGRQAASRPNRCGSRVRRSDARAANGPQQQPAWLPRAVAAGISARYF